MKRLYLIPCLLALAVVAMAGVIEVPEAPAWMLIASGGVADEADTTAPTVTEGAGTNIDTAGTLLTVAFSENVSEGGSYSDGDWTLSCSTTSGLTVAHTTGDGTSSWGFSITGGPVQESGTDTCTLDWAGTADGVEDGSGNDLAAIDPVKTIVNNSTQGASAITDDFADTDAKWTTLAGTAWSITGGLFQSASASGVEVYTDAQTSTVTQTLQAQWRNSVPNYGGVYFRSTNNDAEYAYALRYSNVKGWEWRYCTGTTCTTIQNNTDNGVSSGTHFVSDTEDYFAVQVTGTGDSTVVGVQDCGASPCTLGSFSANFTFEANPAQVADTGKYVGVYNGSNSTIDFDNFSAE